MSRKIQIQTEGLVLTSILTLAFISPRTVLSAPAELTISNFNNNNFLVQQNDDGFNYSKPIPSVNISTLSWQTLDKMSLENQEALENYTAPDGMSKRYVYYLAGYDHEDRPIWIVEGGKWNIMEGVLKGQGQEMENYFMQMAQTMIKSIPARSTSENPVTHAVFLLDFAGLDFTQLRHIPTVTYALGIASKTIPLIEKYVGEAYLVNANFATQTLLNIVKPIWGAVFSKVTVYGTNKDTWMPKILKALPKNSLPNWYGGEKGYTPVQVYGR